MDDAAIQWAIGVTLVSATDEVHLNTVLDEARSNAVHFHGSALFFRSCPAGAPGRWRPVTTEKSTWVMDIRKGGAETIPTVPAQLRYHRIWRRTVTNGLCGFEHSEFKAPVALFFGVRLS